jgi:hypothetical protein
MSRRSEKNAWIGQGIDHGRHLRATTIDDGRGDKAGLSLLVYFLERKKQDRGNETTEGCKG